MHLGRKMNDHCNAFRQLVSFLCRICRAELMLARTDLRELKKGFVQPCVTVLVMLLLTVPKWLKVLEKV